MPLRRRTFLLGAGATALSPSLTRADLYDDYMNAKSRLPFVVFLARDSKGRSSKPGHSFVGTGVEVDNGELIYLRFFGFYPASEDTLTELKSVFGKVTGDIAYKMKDLNWKLNFRVSVTDEQVAKANAIADKWKSNDPKYNLLNNGGRNCSAFAAEIAAAVGLKVPDGAGSKFPITFMTQMRDLNKPAPKP